MIILRVRTMNFPQRITLNNMSVSSASFLFLLLIQPLKPNLSKFLSKILKHEIRHVFLNIQSRLMKKLDEE